MIEIIDCTALLFDMDGVLIDSTSAVERAWTEFATQYGLDVEFVMSHTHGRRTAETVRVVAPNLDAEAEAARMEGDEVKRAGEVGLLPGVRELLDSIPADVWGVVTSASRVLARARLESNGLAVPNVLVTAADVRAGKPDPEGYAVGARLLGAAPEECVVFEDAPPGIEAARRAGARVIGVATTFSSESLVGVDVCVDSLAGVSIQATTDGRLLIRTTEPWPRHIEDTP